MNKIALTIAALAASMALCAQSTQKFTAGKMNEYGLVYTLPTTAVNVTVEAERTVKTPGEFKLYSKKYLNIDPILEPDDVWTIKSVTLSTSGISDNADSYLVQFKSGSAPFMILDDNNCPLAVNDESFTLPTPDRLPQPVEMQPSILQTPAAAQAVTAEMLQSQSTAKRAQLAAAKIYELRQSRNDIISGNADQMPADGEAMKLALDNLAKQEAALTAMFTGTVQTATAVRTYTVVPGTSDSKIVAARVSATDGTVDTDDLSGVPVYLTTKVVAKGSIPTNEKGEEKKFPKGGLAYCVPGQATFTATVANRQLAEIDAEVAQLGIVFGIDPALFSDKKAPAYAIFDPTTGAIREIGTK